MSAMHYLHAKFYAHKDMKNQDAMLLKLCSIKPILKSTRPRVTKQTTIKYAVFSNKQRGTYMPEFFFKYFWNHKAQGKLCPEKVLLCG